MKLYLYYAFYSFCVLLLSISSAFAQRDMTLSAYTNQTVITAISSITLAPGFEIPEGKTVNIFTGVNFDNWVALSSKPSTDQNYILARIFRRAGIKTDTDASSNIYNTAEVNQTIQYFDGLGRSSQTVMVQASPKFSDVVLPMTYDAFGREDKKYQPYAIKDNSGTYRTDALKDLKDFYASPGAGIAATDYPFGVTVFEPSPLNRAIEQGAPGAPWQPVSESNTGHTQKMEYGTNDDEVKLWTVTADGASGAKNYTSGSLYKTTFRDENGKPGTLTGSTDEYKDLEGHVVLKRVWENETKSLSTYYVYDDLGNLRYVLPPAVNENGQSTVSSFKETDDVFKQFIYCYHYDVRKRLIEKKVAGKGWAYMVYNSLDQLVLVQDANQSTANQWVFTKYDVFGRVIGTGKYTDASKRDVMQVTVNGQTVLWESREVNDTGYDNLSFPQTAGLADYYLINYYDDYSFPGVGTVDQPSGNQVGAEQVKSLLTGTKVRILGTGTMLLSIHYYDAEGRLVQSKVENHLGGKDIIDNTYNFAGELIASNRSHTIKSTVVTTTVANRYFYDHIGRKIATTENINGQGEVVLNKLNYTETGQLLSKQLHSTNNGGSYLQQTTYSYNERGWLVRSMGDQFNLQLKYNDGDVPQWNGNIANQIWGRSKGSLDNTFAYTYDPLNRLTKAVSPNLGEAISYDVMGNIKTLEREGKGINTYSGYTGNQLTKIMGFTNSEYSYDDNGNLTYDKEKNIKLTYNYLNLPQTITGRQNLSYLYDATGNKLKKTSGSEITDYIGGIQHKTDGTIDIISTEEGVARNNGGTYSYEYTLTDHLGNNRATFYKNPLVGIEVQQKDDYFAFGLRRAVFTASSDNKYLYNKKELQEELGQYDYGARFYDPVIGRWNVVDPLAEKFVNVSPYNYALNNLIKNIDPNGMEVVAGLDQESVEGTYEGAEAQSIFIRLQSLEAQGGPGDKEKPKPKVVNNNSFNSSFNKLMDFTKKYNPWVENIAGGLEFAGADHSASLYSQGYRRGVSGNYRLTGRNLSLFEEMPMTLASTPISTLSKFGSGLGKFTTFVGGGLLGYEGYQTYNNVEGTDWSRFGYHSTAFGTSLYIGKAFGGPAGFTVGLAATAGEFAYDTAKQVLLDLTGQWGTIVQSINSANMGRR